MLLAASGDEHRSYSSMGGILFASIHVLLKNGLADNTDAS